MYKVLLNNKKKIIGTPKFIPNLNNKQNYINHYLNLKYYLQLGLKITPVHKPLKFKLVQLLRKYIIFNIEKRKGVNRLLKKAF